jgi:hypothetical protein
MEDVLSGQQHWGEGVIVYVVSVPVKGLESENLMYSTVFIDKLFEVLTPLVVESEILFEATESFFLQERKRIKINMPKINFN